MAPLAGGCLAARLRGSESEIRREFTKLHWCPEDESFRIRGRYVPHDKPRTMELATNLGDVLTPRTSGSVVLTLKGEALRLTAIDYGDRLWFVFSDPTSRGETYSAARFLDADMPGLDGMTTVDFSQAYNPPCAFNPYTTCLLPPPENQLQVRIEAGELDYVGRR
ncbi:MAG: DUF1684 domain-containing protein [Gemmatimonadetes bacterium]|nr:DUF1684 domain-containing protein [Gemmatimonadota bacterium]